jgi:hypothetical protein
MWVYRGTFQRKGIWEIRCDCIEKCNTYTYTYTCAYTYMKVTLLEVRRSSRRVLGNEVLIENNFEMQRGLNFAFKFAFL